MPLANVASEAAAVKRALNGGGTLLVVGGRSTNFPESIRNNPRVKIWETTDPKSASGVPPDNTKVIICTRWLGHTTFAKLQRFATKRHILMMPGLGGTGEIKDVIEMALGAHTATPSTPPPPPTSSIPDTPKMFDEPDAAVAKPRAKGYVKAFVQQHANLDAVPSIDEARRLLKLAEAHDVPTTESTIVQTLYLLRRERDGLPSTVKTKAAPAPAKKPAVPVSNVGEALRLIDDVATGLSLLREAVLKVQQDEAQMQSTMTALRGFLNAQGAH